MSHPNHRRVQRLYDMGKTRKYIAHRLNMKLSSVDFWINKVKRKTENREPLKLRDEHIDRRHPEAFKKYWQERPYHFAQMYGSLSMNEAYTAQREILRRYKTEDIQLKLTNFEDEDMTTYSIAHGEM